MGSGRAAAATKSTAVTAAAARARGSEINTAKRLLKIGFAPVDLLYSESLTKSYQKALTNRNSRVSKN